MKTIRSVSSIVAAVALLAFSVPVHADKNDSKIETSAKESYVFKTYLKNDNIKIQSKDGIVTLTGEVLEESHVSMAQETVAGLPGVKRIDNKLQVKGMIPAKNSDAWLITKVRSTLLFHRSVSASTTEVDVINGIVMLKGTAETQAQKDLTAEYAKDVEGVKEVRNEIKVAKSAKKPETVGEKIDDASITAQVKMTLLYHRSTSAISTNVETNQGVVTLRGKAKNASEIALATKLANDVNGVNSVKNRMTIE